MPSSVDRSAILRFVCEKLPEASAWVEWVLCAAAPLYIGSQQLLCTTGVQQGDPMGPLLFAAGIHNVISKVAAEYPGEWCIWYLDDGTVIGDLNTLNAVAARLSQELNGAGLTPVAKGYVFWESRLEESNTFKTSSVLWWVMLAIFAMLSPRFGAAK